MTFIDSSKTVSYMDYQNPAVATVEQDEPFCVESTEPPFGQSRIDEIRKTGVFPKRKLAITGPIEIQGVTNGNSLAVRILNISLKETGRMWMGPGWLGLLRDDVDVPLLKEVRIVDGMIDFGAGRFLPLRKMVGTVGVAPSGKAVECLEPGDHGANMDLPLVSEGAVLYLPIEVDGALLAVGDVHAAMGDGESFGTGVEIGSFVTMTATEVERKFEFPWLETEEVYAIIANGSTLEEASRIATKRAINFVGAMSGMSFVDTYAFVAQYCHLRIAQVVNPLVTVYVLAEKALIGVMKR